ncbi:MAG: Fe2+-dependent dioxygenase [Gammaproteobacteria bacterium]|nr:Fe2+-dependent dioxygenase [Gammaproteobacteria bacterium]
MFLQIEDFLSPSEVASLIEIARHARFIDGRNSNPHNQTKVSLIGDPADPAAQKASQIALAAFQRSEAFRDFAYPERMATPSLCRYDAGMRYGTHIDVAFLPVSPAPLRSDVSCTIFLSDPSTYEGGDLIVHLGTEELRIKGKPGSAIVYPSTTLHEVAPVTAGSRLVVITFVQSRIPDPMQREILYTLGEVRALEGLKMEWDNRMRMEYAIANLQRMWSR